MKINGPEIFSDTVYVFVTQTPRRKQYSAQYPFPEDDYSKQSPYLRRYVALGYYGSREEAAEAVNGAFAKHFPLSPIPNPNYPVPSQCSCPICRHQRDPDNTPPYKPRGLKLRAPKKGNHVQPNLLAPQHPHIIPQTST
jgi:hypothetical protein